jgi:hypothetical protein
VVDVAGLFLLDVAEESFATGVGIIDLEPAMMRTLEGNAIMDYSLVNLTANLCRSELASANTFFFTTRE